MSAPAADSDGEDTAHHTQAAANEGARAQPAHPSSLVRIGWRDVWIGALGTSLLFEVG